MTPPRLLIRNKPQVVVQRRKHPKGANATNGLTYRPPILVVCEEERK